jgi:hypothetical protein
VTPRHVRPILASALSITLLALALAGPAGAADSRDLTIGTDTNGDGIPEMDGLLVPTPVTAGGVTKIEVAIASNDNQTIANALLYFPGISATGTRDSLPDGAMITGVFGPDSAGCMPVPTPTTPASSVACDLGNIAAYGKRDVSFIVSVPTADSSGTLFTASVETNNENGSNNQIFSADSGGFTIGAFNPDSVSTFIPPGQLKSTNTSSVSSTNHLQTTIEFQASSQDGDAIEIGEASTADGKYPCPAHLTCQPDYTTVSIDNGSGSFSQPPYIKWVLNALVPSSYNPNKAFAAHYKTVTIGGTPTIVNDWTLFWKNTGDRCGSNLDAAIAATGHCFSSVTVGPVDKTTGLASAVLVLYTNQNGAMHY